MSWTQEDMEGDTEVSVWFVTQKRARKKKMLAALGLIALVLGGTWIGIKVTLGVARVDERERIEFNAFLKGNGCKLVSHRDDKWIHHFWQDYWEHIPGEDCYECSKTGKKFCR